MIKTKLKKLVLATAINTVSLASAGLSWAEDTIKVGVLHSLSGTMAISETTLKCFNLKDSHPTIPSYRLCKLIEINCP